MNQKKDEYMRGYNDGFREGLNQGSAGLEEARIEARHNAELWGAAEAELAKARKAKPLEWQPSNEGYAEQWFAPSVFGEYCVYEHHSIGAMLMRPGGNRLGEPAGDTLEAAKAAAQADFEQRILSAIA